MSLRLVWVNFHTPHGTRVCILEVWRIVAGCGCTHAHCSVVVTHKRGGGGTRPCSLIVCLWRCLFISPLLILTLCGPERVLVVSTEPLDDLSCLTTPGLAVPETGCCPCRGPGASRCTLQIHAGFADSSTGAHWGVHLQDNFPDRGF